MNRCNHLTAFAVVDATASTGSSVPVAAIVVPIIVGSLIIAGIVFGLLWYRKKNTRNESDTLQPVAITDETGPDALSRRTFSQKSMSGVPLMILPNTPVGSPRPVPIIPLTIDALDDSINRQGSTAGLLVTPRTDRDLYVLLCRVSFVTLTLLQQCK